MIHILDTITANGIAAGEVVERPASVVKELIENSLDAGASIIHCDIEQGGIKKILISDNGCGMNPEDAKKAFSRHATSKLTQISDLDHIVTMGFRGEALASIAAVSRVILRTREIGADQGFEVIIDGGKVVSTQHIGCPEGTQIEVRDLFYNVPARYKFLKRDQTEQGYISDLITRLALARADISFRLSTNNKDLIHTPGNNNLLSAIYVLFGKKTAEAMVEVDFELDPVKIIGYIATPQVTRGNRSRQVVFVNGRNIHSKVITSAINEATKTWFMKGKFPSLVINLEIPLNLVDVNVHPQKTEVRFWDDQVIFRAVLHSLKQALESGSTIIKGELKSEINQSIAPLILEDRPQSISSESSPAKQIEFDQKIDHEQADPIQAEDKTSLADQRLHPREQAKAFLRVDQENQEAVSLDKEKAKSEINKFSVNGKNNSKLLYLINARLIGQVFQTYLLLEYQDECILIDQHAAHERIIYEQLYVKYLADKEKPFDKQILLQAESIELTAYEISLVEDNLDKFDHLGFEIDIFGENTILVRSVPYTKKGLLEAVSAVQVIIDALVEEPFSQEDKYTELLYDVACKAAVKAHDKLSFSEMKQLISDLTDLNNPFHCPHGRPLMIKLTKTDFEKMFKRIV